jgi:hypothetical protein
MSIMNLYNSMDWLLVVKKMNFEGQIFTSSNRKYYSVAWYMYMRSLESFLGNCQFFRRRDIQT